MALTFNNVGLPGYGSELTTSSKAFLRSLDRYSEDVGGVVLNGSLSRDIFNSADPHVLSNGTVLTRITSTGLYRPLIVGVTNGAISSGTATSITVTADSGTEIGRLRAVAGGNLSAFLVGPPSAGGTVAATAITITAASGTTVTISSVSLPAVTDKSYIVIADGSANPVAKGFLSSDFGLRVTNQANASVNTPVGKLIISGDIQETALPFNGALNADCVTYIFSQLNTEGRTFTRSSSY